MIVQFENSISDAIQNLHSKLLDVINDFARDQQTMPISHDAASIQSALILSICKLHSAASASERDFHAVSKIACNKIMQYQYKTHGDDE